jgi:hypothetical protein
MVGKTLPLLPLFKALPSSIETPEYSRGCLL